MRTFVGMILGALLLIGGVYVYDSMQTSANRTLVNWDVVASNWHALKTQAHDDLGKMSSK